MEPLPRGAQFIRSKIVWEIALGIAGDPAIPYYGNRDVALIIGNGSGENLRPWLRMSPGSPILVHAVVRSHANHDEARRMFAGLGPSPDG